MPLNKKNEENFRDESLTSVSQFLDWHRVEFGYNADVSSFLEKILFFQVQLIGLVNVTSSISVVDPIWSSISGYLAHGCFLDTLQKYMPSCFYPLFKINFELV